jgi:hypothetical protein
MSDFWREPQVYQTQTVVELRTAANHAEPKESQPDAEDACGAGHDQQGDRGRMPTTEQSMLMLFGEDAPAP